MPPKNTQKPPAATKDTKADQPKAAAKETKPAPAAKETPKAAAPKDTPKPAAKDTKPAQAPKETAKPAPAAKETAKPAPAAAKDSKSAPKETAKPAAKDAKPAAKDAKPAAKSTKVATDKKTGDAKAAKPADKKPADKKAADAKPADKKSADKKVADKKATDKKTTDKKTGSQKTTDKKTGDKKTDDKKNKVPVKGGKVTKPTKAAPPPPPVAPKRKKIKIWETKKPNYGIGNDIQPKRDLTRFVKWPRYVVLQRKRRVLGMRLKVPPSINQFTRTVNANFAANIFRLLNKYRPEDRAAKKQRLLKAAEARKAAAAAAAEARKASPAKPVSTAALIPKTRKPIMVKCGVNHVTKLIEEKKAIFVVIAHDVDPIELVIFLPALCRKLDIPYCIVKSKARLGQVVHKKTATCLALTAVRPEDRQSFSRVVTAARSNYNNKYEEMRKSWGGGVLGPKSQAVANRRQKALQEAAKEKAKYQQ